MPSESLVELLHSCLAGELKLGLKHWNVENAEKMQHVRCYDEILFLYFSWKYDFTLWEILIIRLSVLFLNFFLCILQAFLLFLSGKHDI